MAKLSQPESVSSVLKIFSILEELGQQKEIGVSDLAQKLMTSKATTYRFLQTMKSLGYVTQEKEADKYSITLKLFELGAKSLEHVNILDLAEKEMRAITEQTNETVHLGTLDEDTIIYLHKTESSHSLRMHSRVGRRNPIYSTAIGKILLSETPEPLIRRRMEDVNFKKNTHKTIENIEQFLVELTIAKEQNFAEDNEEQEPGLYCMAAPIYDRFGNILYGISISLPTVRFDEKRKSYYMQLLHNAGRNISTQLGFYNYPI